MRKSNKFLAMLLVLVLAVSCLVFAACNDDTPAPTPTPEGTTPEVVRKGAYVLTDKATYLSYKNNKDATGAAADLIPNLTLLYEADNDLKNTYSLIAVDGSELATPTTLNEIGADCFIKWMLSDAGHDVISVYGEANFGGALFTLLEGAQTYAGAAADITYAGSGATDNVISISTTTSVNDSGLFNDIEEAFEEDTGFDIQVSSKGTGKAIGDARDGNADLLLVHSKSQEATFIATGAARVVEGLTGTAVDADNAGRIPFMFNYFVLVGSANDPADVEDAESIKDAFARIAEKSYFVSRGDQSGTHTKEVSLWNADLNITSAIADIPNYTWYLSTGIGMGQCLTMANVYSARYSA